MAYNLKSFSDNPREPHCVNLICVNNGHSRVSRKFPKIFRRSTNPNLNRPLRINYSIQDRKPKWTAVMKFCLIELTRGVAVRIDMNQAYGVVLSNRLEYRIRNRMVASYS